MAASTPEQTANYLANPRRCIDCGGDPIAGHLRCQPCQFTYAAGGVDIGPALRKGPETR